MENKRCVVTGGAGFIGSHLVDSLLISGHTVMVWDNLITGKEQNLHDAQKNKNFTFLNVDITKELPEVGSVDFIYHLASPASVPDYQKYAIETARVNSVGTQKMLAFAKKNNAKFLFTSTSEVYGDPLEHPQKETYWGNVNPNGVRACYDESKRFGEMMVMLYVRNYGINARIARIFNTYGSRMRPDDGRVVSNLINQAIRGHDITLYGNGTQTRSFCFVEDMVEGLIMLMESNNAQGEVINLGNPEEYTVSDLAKKIIQMTGTVSKIIYKDLPKDDPIRRRPDIAKAKQMLGWNPKILLDDGLQKTINYYKSLQ